MPSLPRRSPAGRADGARPRATMAPWPTLSHSSRTSARRPGPGGTDRGSGARLPPVSRRSLHSVPSPRITRPGATVTRSAISPTALLLLALLAAAQASAQRPASSIVIVTGGEPSMPIPTLMEGAQNQVANFEVADHLFLRLANLGPGLINAGDRGFVPMLARSWS